MFGNRGCLNKYLASADVPVEETDRERCARLVREAQSKGYTSALLIGRYAGMSQEEVNTTLRRMRRCQTLSVAG